MASKFFQIALGCLFLSLWVAISSAAIAQNPPCTPTKNYTPIAERLSTPTLLFQLKRCGLPTSYVFGTFHSDAPSLTGIYHQATAKLQKTKQLALEVVMTEESRAAARASLTTSATAPSLEKVLGDALYRRVQKHIAPLLDLKPNQLQRYKPWALAVLLQYPKAEADGVVLDEKLQRFAQSWGVGVVGLETVPQQMSIFDQMPQAMQTDFLGATLDDLPSLPKQHDELKSLYESKDLAGIYAMSERLFGEMNAKHETLADYLKDRVLLRRNKTMAARIQALSATATFFAVGALHLPGDQGVLHLLETRGYEIFPITEEVTKE